MNDMANMYPTKNGRSKFMYGFRKVLSWIMLLAVLCCPVINYLIKGPLWSPIVLVSIFFLWRMLLAPDVLEMSSLGLVFRTGSYVLVLVMTIGLCLSPGWLGFVLPIIGFSILLLSAVFYLINIRRHRHDAMPFVWEILVSILVFLIVYETTDQLNWPMVVLGSISSLFAAIGLIAFHKELWHELVKRFHT